MAPQLFDLVWEVYQKSGATQPINIVSAYRSPVTNAYLHSHSRGVAEHSQHMLGHAMDFFIPGIPLTRLRQLGIQQQVGGVGFYPTSGSPFVHMDVGTVRAWPRMTTAQLEAIFPDGKTIHVPSDGRVLSQTGYAYAQTQWNTCHAVPCTNAAALQGGAAGLGHDTMVAAATTSATGKTFSDIFHGVDPGNHSITNPGDISTAPDASVAVASNDSDNDDETADDDVTAGPAQTAVATVEVTAPIPLARPPGLEPVMQTASVDETATLAAAAATPFDSLFPSAYDNTTTPPLAALAGGAAQPNAPMPAQKSYDMMLATGELARSGRPQSAVAAIAAVEAPVPAPLRPGLQAGDTILSAYASLGPGSPAENQLESIIENETTGAIAMAPSGGTALTNSVGSPIGADALKSYAAEQRNHQAMPPALARMQLASFTVRDTAMVAPGFSADLVRPVAMTSDSFAVFVEPAATDLNPATELGPMVVRLGFRPDHGPSLNPGRFAPANPLLVAFR
jgi:hypothetical protein